MFRQHYYNKNLSFESIFGSIHQNKLLLLINLLSISNARLGISAKIFWRVVYVIGYAQIKICSNQLDIRNYYKLLISIVNYIRRWDNVYSKVDSAHFRILKISHILFSFNIFNWIRYKDMPNNDICTLHFDIHFIRTQKRYNKRRYSRVRSYSRASFFSGILCSCIFVGMFWGATLYKFDWILVQSIIVDVNIIIFFLYCIIGWRFILLDKEILIKCQRALYTRRKFIFNYIVYKYTFISKWFK